MAAKIAKYLILSIVGLFIIVTAVIAVLDDETIEASTGPLASSVLSVKHSVGDGISSVTHAISGSVHNIIGGSESHSIPRVVQALPPPPTPSMIAKPVESKSLAEIAAETEQEYARREMSMTENSPSSTEADPPIASEPTITEVEQTSGFESSAPPPPASLGSEGINSLTASASPEAMMAEQPASEPMSATPPSVDPSIDLSGDTQLSENALLESLNEQPPDDVAALPPEAPEEVETPESALEEDTDPNGEQAYAEGLKFYSGEGVERNFGSAAQYFMKAAERGHSEAQYSLGLMNYVGQTGGQDFANAAKWFQLAAESGHVQAQYNLGFLYYEGKGVRQDLKTAFGWIDRAAEQGYAKAIKARDALQKAMPEMFGT